MLCNFLLFLLFGLLAPVYAQAAVRQLYQFPNTVFHDIENIAIRPNGKLLLTTITEPVLYTLDPSASNPIATVVHHFDGYSGLAGITEVSPDLFAVVVGNYSVAEFRGIQGSFTIWTVNLNPTTPVVKKVASLPAAQTLNGLTNLSSTLVLVADSAVGAVYSVDITSGASKITIQDAKFQASAYIPLGINGIHTRGSNLYYTNSAQNTYGMVPITAAGTAAGPASVIATGPVGTFVDDFAFDIAGSALITAHSTSIIEVPQFGGGFEYTVANSSQIVQPTSAIFGNKPSTLCTLYVVTAGQVTGTLIVSGQVLAVSVC